MSAFSTSQSQRSQHRYRSTTMPTNDLKAWDVYARQLMMVGHGYPLWNPQPNKRRSSDSFDPPVQIGDVGYVSNGTFIRLFNATKDAHDEINQAHGVPSDRYVKFEVGERGLETEVPNIFTPGTLLCSHTIRNIGEEITGQMYVAALLLNDEFHHTAA